jgi:hypothetical protein
MMICSRSLDSTGLRLRLACIIPDLPGPPHRPIVIATVRRLVEVSAADTGWSRGAE